ncbi:MAG: KpsF/GutQ family sugar-phosphate isomerase [Chlamydiia bacterium]|nr:KpsF/GutQ family sugar-phosphate isomerase [Chlamydiia bacterium]
MLSSTDLSVVSEVFQLQRENLSYFFDQFDLSACEGIMQSILQCKGTLFFTGIGKSALVGKKIAATLVSTGTRSLYISAANALHGDLGIVEPGDLFFLLSKSGETQELLNLLPFLKQKQATSYAVVCEPNSRLLKACDGGIVLPMNRELCPFNLAPTTSAAIQALFGDLICASLMRLKGFSIDAYAANHPAGKLGKRLSLTVSDLMLTGESLPLCSKEVSLESVLELFSAKKCGCMLVVDDRKKLIGIFTDGDLRRSLEQFGKKAFQMPMNALMVSNPRTVPPGVLAWEALKRMEGDVCHPITVLPVVDSDQQLVGLLRLHDLLQAGL